MKTVCLYFQVHQPWRLKRYRFFSMGKDHNYLMICRTVRSCRRSPAAAICR